MLNTHNKNRKIIISIFLILVVTFLSYAPSLRNGFVNWDDGVYVTNSEIIKSFSLQNIKEALSTPRYGYYHPVTLFSYMFDYHFFHLNPRGYHLTNLVLHLFNSSLVFWLVIVLSDNWLAAFVTAILFGVHPLHVEPVAWISSRKDLLSALFFLGAIIYYVYYLRLGKAFKYYILSLSLFILSVLSKPMAITFPLVLLLVDFFLNRRFERHILLDKIPFFALSFIFSILAFVMNSSVGAVRTGEAWNLFDKIWVAGYSIAFYLNKLFIPTKLACLYPRVGVHFSIWFLSLSLIFIILVTAIILFVAGTKKIIFGCLFFLITLIPVLQFVPFSEAVVADRYVYIPSLGILYLLGEGFAWLYKRPKRNLYIIRVGALAILICLIGIFFLVSRKRCQAWKDSLTLWSNVLNNYPGAIMAYNNRAIAFAEREEYDKAISDFNHVINFVSDGDRKTIYLYLVYLYRRTGKNEEAALAYRQAQSITARLAEEYYNAGNVYLEAGSNKQAIVSYRNAVAIDPDNVLFCNALARVYIMGRNYKEAETVLKKALQIDQSFPLTHNNLAALYYYEKRFDLAVKHCDKAIALGYQVTPRLLELLKPYRK